MSDYDDTLSSGDWVCPYCGSQQHVESEEYSEDSRVEECDECGMNYHAYESFEVDHHAVPDCDLNKIDHKWMVSTRNSEFYHCEICGRCSRASKIATISSSD